MASFSDLVRAPKAAPAAEKTEQAAPAAQPAPAAAPAPAAQPVEQTGVTVADLLLASDRFQARARAAQARRRVDDFAIRNEVVAADLAGYLSRYGSFKSEKQAEFARKIVLWSLPREQQQQTAPVVEQAAPAPAAQPARSATWAALQPFARLSAGKLQFRKKHEQALWWVLFDGTLVGKAESGTVIGWPSKCRAAGIDPAEVKAALDAFEADPLAALRAHGVETGSCGCCGRELTDPESIAFGIGPICRERGGF